MDNQWFDSLEDVTVNKIYKGNDILEELPLDMIDMYDYSFSLSRGRIAIYIMNKDVSAIKSLYDKDKIFVLFSLNQIYFDLIIRDNESSLLVKRIIDNLQYKNESVNRL